MLPDKDVLKRLQKILEESKYTVVLSGYGMTVESGYPALRDGDISYDIEQRYGYSTDELMHSSCFSTRKELFYEFYRNEILSALQIPPGKGYQIVAELQKRGLVQSIITKRFFGLSQRAGCENVINLYGNVYENYCTHCGRKYSMEYVRDAKKVPLCESCHMPIRPNIVLIGEAIDNAVMTRAAAEVEKADVLLILGTKLTSNLCRQLTGYYKGKKLILITLYPHYSDQLADFVINERVDKTLEALMECMNESKENE